MADEIPGVPRPAVVQNKSSVFTIGERVVRIQLDNVYITLNALGGMVVTTNETDFVSVSPDRRNVVLGHPLGQISSSVLQTEFLLEHPQGQRRAKFSLREIRFGIQNVVSSYLLTEDNVVIQDPRIVADISSMNATFWKNLEKSSDDHIFVCDDKDQWSPHDEGYKAHIVPDEMISSLTKSKYKATEEIEGCKVEIYDKAWIFGERIAIFQKPNGGIEIFERGEGVETWKKESILHIKCHAPTKTFQVSSSWFYLKVSRRQLYFRRCTRPDAPGLETSKRLFFDTDVLAIKYRRRQHILRGNGKRETKLGD